MVMFWPVQQELNCINGDGSILGKIQFDAKHNTYVFSADNEQVVLSASEDASIKQKLAKLVSGHEIIPMQDDD
ncbi:MAG: hypothetical protein HWE18_08980 [Gammaproteobacteria bacterium]|nr:hypothetical protein [Gammaproteobacteria bacterium]